MISDPKPSAPVDPPRKHEWKAIELTEQAIVREEPNLLVLGFCDLKSGDVERQNINTTLADDMNWKQHGCEKNIWSFTAQFRRSFIDKRFPEDSGFTVDYHFDIAPDAFASVRTSLEVAVERPRLFRITLNGETVSFDEGERWFDEAIRKVSIAEQVKPGANTLQLTARPMRPLCEIMPVYVLGMFSLQPTDAGFIIGRDKPMAIGAWTDQGMPFYSGNVAYRYAFELDEPTEALAVSLPQWQGTLARVRIDGNQLGLIAWPPDRLEVQTPLSAESHTLEISIAGNPRNQMGPHFSRGLPIIYSWIYGAKTRQGGEEYILWPCGLDEPPRLETSK